LLCKCPVAAQLVPMKLGPVEHKTKGAPVLTSALLGIAKGVQ
jgi:hypothetical protein